MHENGSAATGSTRNYQLDFLKLIFALFVFLTHSALLMGVNTTVSLPPGLGGISVHFFFVVSGMLMTNSIMKQPPDITEAGKSAISFVLRKFKGIFLEYWTSFAIYIYIYIAHIYLYISEEPPQCSDILKILFRAFPEMLLMTNSGVVIEYNTPTWYLSAMFICMLPLAYMLYRHRDFFINVLAPLAAVLLLGFWYQVSEKSFGENRNVFYGFVVGGIIRATFGLCFGVIAWQIYNKLRAVIKRKSQRILITAAECFLWFAFFFSWLVLRDAKTTVSVLFILPIALAITFSGESYICRLFKFKLMRFLSPLSLAIYLNHRIARELVIAYFPDCSYKLGLSLMALFTILICLLYWLLMFLRKQIWDKKLKSVFSNQEEFVK